MSRRSRIVEVLGMDPPKSGLCIKGWLRTVRSSKDVAFLNVNDGSNLSGIQVVINAELPNADEVRHLTTGSAVSVEGELVVSKGKGQRVELNATHVDILDKASDDFPLQKKRAGFDYLRTITHLRHRTNSFGAVFRVRSALSFGVHEFFQARGFNYLHAPIITSSDAEGAGEMFRVTTVDMDKPPRGDDGKVDWSQDFFGKPTFLTVSGQLNAEAFALGMSDVYTFGPTFRAENSNTTRHVAEFWMIEPEMAFCDLQGDCDMAQAFVQHLVQKLLNECQEDLEFFNLRIDKGLLERLNTVVKAPFERMTYREAVSRLEASGHSFEHPLGFGVNLQAEHERYLSETLIGRPVFVTDYPKSIKAFYMRRNDDGETVAAVDLLVPGVGELIGGSQREERHDVLLKSIEEHGLPAEIYQWYLDTRRFGTVEHSGFGLGFERMIMYCTGMQNIRDVIPFPRSPRTCEF